MPVIAVILSALMGWVVFWLVRYDGHEVVASYFSAAARQRRMQRARDAEAKAAVRSVTEARDGALALLIKLGSVDHAVLPAAENLIDGAARTVFAYGDKLVEHRTFADYVARNTPSFSVLFRELAPLFDKQLSRDERHDLVDLMHKVAEAAGGMTPARREMLDEVQARLLPQRTVRG
ncbi:hypothetical protein [Labrys neptuniae]